MQVLSSFREVMAAVKPEERIAPELDLSRDMLPTLKTMGLLWDSENDVFRFKIDTSRPVKSKRHVLKESAMVFDPLGMLAPVMITARILIQDIWRLKITWDEDLPEEILSRWTEWFSKLALLQDLKIPRCLHQKPRKSTSYHVFCDASEKAFGAIVYARNQAEDGTIEIRFVMAKARVAPLRFLTIPKLEMQAAVIGCRLAITVSSELQVDYDQFTFWGDSEPVLKVIQGHGRYQTFFANRAAECLEKFTFNQWRRVPGKLNPADDVSRGIDPSERVMSHRFFNGPEFLAKEECEWPIVNLSDEQFAEGLRWKLLK